MAEPQLIQDYIIPGDVKLEYRHLAFLGDESVDVGVASLCAEEQDMFWPFHETTYHNQVSGVSYDSGAFARERIDRIAETAGLDMDEFENCMDEGEHRDTVEEETEAAGEQGVGSTPSFIVNGQLVTGGDYQNLSAAIDEALAEAE